MSFTITKHGVGWSALVGENSGHGKPGSAIPDWVRAGMLPPKER